MKSLLYSHRFAVSNTIPESWAALLRYTGSVYDILSKTDPKSIDETYRFACKDFGKTESSIHIMCDFLASKSSILDTIYLHWVGGTYIYLLVA